MIERQTKKWAAVAGILLVAIVAGAELLARFYLEWGDPPLFMNDPQLEYINQPNQEGRQIGNHYFYNAYSMRNHPFPEHKQDPRELRIMVLGDSVINGGSRTDQDELATERLQYGLTDALGRPVLVANISCASWGPGNLLAYARKYGFFDADIVVIVLSSHDYTDNPDTKPVAGVDPLYPDTKPILALSEGLHRLVARIRSRAKQMAPRSADSPEDIQKARAAAAALVDLARQANADVVVVQHAEKREIKYGFLPGHSIFENMAQDMNVTLVQLAPAFQAAIDAGQNPYRDNIHPNVLGQQLIAARLHPVLTHLSQNRQN